MTNTREIIRNLRKNSTPAEKIFWEAVRSRRLDGFRFIRQHPIRCYVDDVKRTFIADFYCDAAKLVVEIDGPVHERQKDYDELRTLAIEQKNLRVVRFTNDEVENHLQEFLDTLKSYLYSPTASK